jgi:hypothetical protein
MKTTTTNSLDTLAWLLDVDGREFLRRRAAALSGGDGNEHGRRRRKLWRGGMDSRRLQARPGARRGHGEGWKLLGDDVASPASSVAFHRAAWGRGVGKKTPLPLWAGWAGWAGFALGSR